MEKMYKKPGFKKYRDQRIIELCEFLTPIMNEVHECNYSFRFWSTLLKSHVKSCVNLENIYSEQLIEDKPFILAHNSWELPTSKDRWVLNLRYYGVWCLYNRPLSEVFSRISKSNEICMGLRAEILADLIGGMFCPSHTPMLKPYAGRDKRKKADELAGTQDSIFINNLIRRIPRFYVEYFDYLINKIELIEPENKVFHAEHIGNFMLMIIAYYVEHGAKYYRYQYGGFHGETEDSVREVNYIDIDKYKTYGWKINEKDEPFKALRLEQFKSQYENSSPENFFDAVVSYNKVNSGTKDRYKALSEKLFNQLDKSKFERLLLRPRGITKKFDRSGELAYLNPPSHVSIDKGMMPMAEIVHSSGIVIHFNHPSTNFLECTYINHPIVTILTNSEPTGIVKPYYDFFLEKKVMHTDIESLIYHLNQTDLNSWWKDVTGHPVYKDFKHTFARNVRGGKQE